MAFTHAEIEMAQKAAEMSSSLLPALKQEASELATRIKWHEANIQAWEAMKPDQTPRGFAPVPSSSFVVNGVEIKSKRAGRGVAHDRIVGIMESHPEYKAKDIQKELSRQNGLTYPLSTIYRVLNEVAEKSKTPA